MARRRSYPGYIERRGKAWRLVLQAAGSKRSYTVHARRDVVEQFARDEYAKLSRQAIRREDGLPSSMRMSELFDRYEAETLASELRESSQVSYRVSLRAFRLFFVDGLGDPTIDRIRAAHIHRYLDWRRIHTPDGDSLAWPLSNRSIQKERAILHRIFALAARLEYREGNPVTAIKPPKIIEREPVILLGDQYEALLAECAPNPMLYLFALVMAETGARCESEVLWLKWEHVDFKGEEGTAFVRIKSSYWHRRQEKSRQENHRTKGGGSRWAPMSPRLTSAMREHFATYRLQTYGGKRSPWLFHHTFRNRGAQAGSRIRSMRRSFKSAARRAGLPAEFRQHDLRHTRATNWIKDGHSVAKVQMALGHADIKTTMGYVKLVRGDLCSLVKEPDMSEKEELAEFK